MNTVDSKPAGPFELVSENLEGLHPDAQGIVVHEHRWSTDTPDDPSTFVVTAEEYPALDVDVQRRGKAEDGSWGVRLEASTDGHAMSAEDARACALALSAAADLADRANEESALTEQRPLTQPAITQVGASLRALRLQAGLPLSDVAAELGTSTDYLFGVEQGCRWVSSLFAARITAVIARRMAHV